MKDWRFALLFAIFFSYATLYAQTVPTAPAQRTFHDPTYKI